MVQSAHESAPLSRLVRPLSVSSGAGDQERGASLTQT
jgi:hypothetical protein